MTHKYIFSTFVNLKSFKITNPCFVAPWHSLALSATDESELTTLSQPDGFKSSKATYLSHDTQYAKFTVSPTSNLASILISNKHIYDIYLL